MDSQINKGKITKLEIEITYDIGEGNSIYKATLTCKNRSRFFEYYGFDNNKPPAYMVLDDGEFINYKHVKRVKIKRIRECIGEGCTDQYIDYQL
jgi:hypothetical protein